MQTYLRLKFILCVDSLDGKALFERRFMAVSTQGKERRGGKGGKVGGGGGGGKKRAKRRGEGERRLKRKKQRQSHLYRNKFNS